MFSTLPSAPAMMHEPISVQPSPAVVATFELPIPKSLANKRLVTRNQLVRGVTQSHALSEACLFHHDGDWYVPPTIATKLFAARKLFSGRERTTLAAVCGATATPFELALLMRGGNRRVEIRDFSGECLLGLADQLCALDDERLWRLCVECIATLEHARESDAEFPPYIFSDEAIRNGFAGRMASHGFAPNDLRHILAAADFRSAVANLLKQDEFLCKQLIYHPALTPRQLKDVFVVLNTPDQEVYSRGYTAHAALAHPACEPDIFSVIEGAHWHEIAERDPTLLAQLWSKFHMHEKEWLSVFASLAQSRKPLAQRLPCLAHRVRKWGPHASAMAAVLLASSPDAALALEARQQR